MITIKKILKTIDCPFLTMYRAREGYHYFEYDDEAAKVYDTISIFVFRLNDMALESWVADGKEFVAKMEAYKKAIAA